MGQLIHELNWIVDRVLYIAPTTARLKAAFREIGEDVAIDFTGQKQSRLVTSKFEGDQALKSLIAFDMGERAGMNSRLQIFGISLDDQPPSPELLASCEALVLDWVPGGEHEDALFEPHILSVMAQKPTLAIERRDAAGSDQSGEVDAAQRLREEGQRQLFNQKAKFFSSNRSSKEFLRIGLEWILSF